MEQQGKSQEIKINGFSARLLAISAIQETFFINLNNFFFFFKQGATFKSGINEAMVWVIL